MNPLPTTLTLLLLPGLAAAATAAQPAKPATGGKAAATQRQPAHLATVQVTAHSDPSAGGARLTAYGDAPLHDTPAAVAVISHRQLQMQQIRNVAELTHTDAALGDAYAPVGYYQNLEIRGFPLDLASGYRLNNLSIAGEQRLGMEEVEQVQVLEGLAGIDAGVMEPGGVVNYVAKQPANVQQLTLGTDSYGSLYTALDAGRWLTPHFGVRANVAWEDMHPYVHHDRGRRAFYSLATTWLINDRATLRFNGDYGVTSQRSVSGYQLLGGTTVPQHVDPRALLAYQPWGPPVGLHTTNLSLHFGYRFDDAWKLKLAVGHSRSVIDDQTAFAYGGFTNAAGEVYFATDGDYGIWDWSSPDDGRENDQARVTLDGRFDTGRIQHDVTLGLSAFRRAVTNRVPLFTQIGTGNIYVNPPPVFAPASGQPGPRAPRLDSRQLTAFALDRIHLAPRWQLVAGLHAVRLHERAWSTDALDYDGAPYVLQRDALRGKVLPQAAVLWLPTPRLTAYLSYSQGLSLGEQAPYWTTNGSDFLPPRLSHQYEAGLKYRWHDALDLNAAIFRIGEPYAFGKPAGGGHFTFVQRGEEVHTGLDLSANGQLTPRLGILASVELLRAHAHDTGNAAYEGHQVQNVPDLRTAVHLNYRLPWLRGLSLLAGWRYSAPNPALPDGSVEVPAYNVFDAGLLYRTAIAGHGLTLNVTVDNLLNQFYWRSTGTDGSDDYLFPGAPRMVRMTARIDL
ncbi:MAG TPA: TonB-dependent siderophore receptor [Nevskiaceae bacterium]|nr:TonB-dependent siderophore receptor [Nevskiaceae bacterium]